MDTKVQEIPIDERLKRLIPPLSKEEFQQLENNCLEDGIRDPLVVAYYPDPDTGEEVEVLADGHNRYEISRKHNISFTIAQKDFESFEDVQIWMIDNQKGRRNLSDYIKFEMAQVKADLLRVKGLEKRKETLAQNTSVLSIVDKTEAHNTQKEIASDLGWSTGKVAMADVVKKHIEETGNDELAEQLRTNELSINKAYQAVKTEKRKKEQQQLKEQLKDIPKPLNIDSFDIIYLDPPWQYNFSKSSNRDIENHYPTMSLQELKDLTLPAKKDCLMYMWATAPKLIEAIELLDSWGFEYKTHAVWDKQKIGMGYWFRGQHEILIVAVKGNFSPPLPENRKSSLFSEPRTKHSKKPQVVYEWIEEAFPTKTKVELFARNTRNDWHSWGNQI